MELHPLSAVARIGATMVPVPLCVSVTLWLLQKEMELGEAGARKIAEEIPATSSEGGSSA